MLSVFLLIQYFFNKPQNDPLAQVSYQKVQIFQTIAKKSSLQLSDGSHQHLQCFKKNVFCENHGRLWHFLKLFQCLSLFC